MKRFSDVSCKIVYWTEVVVQEGDYLLGRRTGYKVISARLMKSLDRKYHLTCLRCDLAEIPESSTKHRLIWSKR